jgi:hypothetical protein
VRWVIKIGKVDNEQVAMHVSASVLAMNVQSDEGFIPGQLQWPSEFK